MVENELDHQGDFGKMGARNGHPPEDGRAVISVSEDQDDPLVARVFPCRGPAPADPGYSKRGRRRRPIYL